MPHLLHANTQANYFQEAMTKIAKRKSDVSEDEMTQIFRTADLDDDGFLTYKEARKAYKKVAKILGRPVDQVRLG